MESNAMTKVSDNIINLIQDSQILVLCLVVAAFTFCGMCMIIPSDKSHDIGKKSLPFVIGGSILALGAVVLANWLYNRIVF